MYINGINSVFKSICVSRCGLNSNAYQFAYISLSRFKKISNDLGGYYYSPCSCIITDCSINPNTETDLIIKSSLYINGGSSIVRYLNHSNAYNNRDTDMITFKSDGTAYYLSIINNKSTDKGTNHSILSLSSTHSIFNSNIISNSDIYLIYFGESGCVLRDCCILKNDCNVLFYTSYSTNIYNCTIDTDLSDLTTSIEISLTPLASFMNTIKFESTAECNIQYDQEILNSSEEITQVDDVLKLNKNFLGRRFIHL